MQSDTERDELVMTLVESALSQPADSLPSFLSRVGAQHPEVSDEVRERVEWELRMQSFLREPIIQRQRNVPAFAPSDLIGGRFKIRRAIGEGGMGSVYEAYDTRLDRCVAIKPHTSDSAGL